MSTNRRVTRAATAAAAAAEAAAEAAAPSPTGENHGGAKNTHVVPSGSKTIGKRRVQQKPQGPNKRQKTGHKQKRQQQPLQIAENAENAPAAAPTPFLSNNDSANLAVNEFSAEPLPNVKSDVDVDAIPSCSKAIKNAPKKRGRKPGSTKKAGASASKFKAPKPKKARKQRGRKPKSFSQILNNKSLQQQQGTDAPGKKPLEKEDSKSPVSKNSKANEELVAKAPAEEDLVPRSSNWSHSLSAANTHQEEFNMATTRMPDPALCASNMELLSDVAVAISMSRDATEQNDAQKSEQAINVTTPMSVPSKMSAIKKSNIEAASQASAKTNGNLNCTSEEAHKDNPQTHSEAPKMTASSKVEHVKSVTDQLIRSAISPGLLRLYGPPKGIMIKMPLLGAKVESVDNSIDALTAASPASVSGVIPNLRSQEAHENMDSSKTNLGTVIKVAPVRPNLDFVFKKPLPVDKPVIIDANKALKRKAEEAGTANQPMPVPNPNPNPLSSCGNVAANACLIQKRTEEIIAKIRKPDIDKEVSTMSCLKPSFSSPKLDTANDKKAADQAAKSMQKCELKNSMAGASTMTKSEKAPNKNIGTTVAPKPNEAQNFTTAKNAAATINLPAKSSDKSPKVVWPIAFNKNITIKRVAPKSNEARQPLLDVQNTADPMPNAISSTKKVWINPVQFVKLPTISNVISAGATGSMNNTVSPPVRIPVRDRPQIIINNRPVVAQKPIPCEMANINAIEIIPEDDPVRPQNVNNWPKPLAIENNSAMEVESQQVPRFAEAVSIFRYAEPAPTSYSNVPLSKRIPKCASKRRIVKEFQSPEADFYMSSTNDICSRQANYLNEMLSYLNQRRNVNPLPLTMEDDNDDNEEEKNQLQYFDEINHFFKTREASYKVADYMKMQTDLTVWMRSLLIDWMFSTSTPLQIHSDTVHLAIKLVDHYLSNTLIKKEDLQMVGASALLIACKHGEYKQPSVSDIMFLGDGAYKRADLLEFEIKMLKDMDFRLHIPYAYDFLNRYAAYASIRKSILFLARYVLEMSLMECALLSYPDSMRAAAALYIALRMRNGHWDATLEDFSGYKLEHFAEIVPLLNAPLHRKPTTCILTIRDKYSLMRYFEVTRVPLLDHFTIFRNNDNDWTEQFKHMRATANIARQPNI